MTRQRRERLPKNRLLRRTVYGLWLATPMLACGPVDDTPSCLWVQQPSVKQEIPLGEGEPLPAQANCELCSPPKSESRLLKCEAWAIPGKQAYQLVCTHERCNRNDGRRPEGLSALQHVEAHGLLGALTAEMAWLEAASVPAFLRLAEELTAHGAPEALVRAARSAAGDEVRHARVMRAFAEQHGALVPDVELPPFSPRSLEALLIENAVEGCVRETQGALVVGWQARHAGHEGLRRTLRPIARDELLHAELAWAVDAWGGSRLGPEPRARVREAHHEALRELERELEQRPPPESLVREAGLPSREQSLAMMPGLAGLLAPAA